jgi:hypothetical protein
MSLKINEQTATSRLRDAKEAVTAAGAEYDRAKKNIADFRDACRGLVEDEAIVRRRRELNAERDRLFHILQEKVQLVSFYHSAMPLKRPEDWKKHERRA